MSVNNMIRIIAIIILIITNFPITSVASCIHYFNTDVLGKSISNQIYPLKKSAKVIANIIEPKIIQLDTDNGVYVSASIFYSADEISFNELIDIIDKQYPQTRNIELNSDKLSIWRIENLKFTISISSQVEDGLLRVMYIKFMSTDKVINKIIKYGAYEHQ